MQTLKKIRAIPQQWKDSTFGIEFECRHPQAEALWDRYQGFFYFSSDGSLSWHTGLEIISQPLPKELLIKKLQKLSSLMGEVLSPDIHGAIHIHIPQSRISREKATNLFLAIRYYPLSLLREFAGRSPNGYCKLVPIHNTDRQTWINTLNKHTIEFRGFTNYENFGIDWAICCLNRLDYWLDHPTVEGMKEAITKYPYQDNTQQPQDAPLTLGDLLRERLRNNA